MISFAELFLTEDFAAKLPLLTKKYMATYARVASRLEINPERSPNTAGLKVGEIIQHLDQTFDPTYPNLGKYAEWLVRQDIKVRTNNDNQDLFWVDAVFSYTPYIKTALTHFDKYKSLYKFQDINKYDFNTLKKEWEELESVKFNREIEAEGKKGTELIYDQNDVQIRKITTAAAAIIFGRGTRWCTSSTNQEGKTTAALYLKQGPLYILHHKGKPIAQVSNDGTIMNAFDVNILELLESDTWIVPWPFKQALFDMAAQGIPAFNDIVSNLDPILEKKWIEQNKKNPKNNSDSNWNGFASFRVARY